VLRAKSFEECVDLANSVDYGLSASLYSTDISRCLRFVELAEVGKVHINSPTIGGEAQAPFGGTKATAIGPHEMGTEVFEFYTESKTVYMDFTGTNANPALLISNVNPEELRSRVDQLTWYHSIDLGMELSLRPIQNGEESGWLKLPQSFQGKTVLRMLVRLMAIFHLMLNVAVQNVYGNGFICLE
jgi:delta 1-pyrroline-5-carboxylate dehydrogenase